MLYEHFIDVINNKPTDLLELPVDNKKEVTESDDDDLDNIEDDINNEYRSDWMYLLEMGPNTTIEYLSDLGNYDIDRQHDWINAGKQNYADSNIIDANNFLQRVIEDERVKDIIKENDEYVETIDYGTL